MSAAEFDKEFDNAPLTIVGVHGEHYQVVTASDRAHPDAKPFDNTDFSAIKRFISRDLAKNESYWRGLLFANFPDSKPSTGDALVNTVATLIQRQRLRLFRFPDLSSTRFVTNGVDKAYHFLAGPSLPDTRDQRRLFFGNEAEVEYFLNSLNSDDEVWQELADDAGLDSMAASIDNREVVQQKILAGDLKVYERRYSPRTPKSDDAELEPYVMPGTREVPLAPVVTKGWIEIKLLYDDDEPVANQDYWIRDSAGTEYTGKTDANGVAKLEDLAPGVCDIKFPELDEWYQ